MPDAEILQTQWLGWTDRPPADGLRRFKDALRYAESGFVPRTIAAEAETTNKDKQRKAAKKSPLGSDQQYTRKMAAGGFGRLGAKERKAWHNFADPRLRGQASPNQETVWRVVDSCRMIGVVNFGEENASVVVEVKGDAFLPQQVRRIVGTALAMAHGWIPSKAWGTAFLDPTCVMETILTPPGRLYLADSRFHFEESRSSGSQYSNLKIVDEF